MPNRLGKLVLARLAKENDRATSPGENPEMQERQEKEKEAEEAQGDCEFRRFLDVLLKGFRRSLFRGGGLVLCG